MSENTALTAAATTDALSLDPRKCPICGKIMRENYGSPKYSCVCGHGEGFVYPRDPSRSDGKMNGKEMSTC